MNRLSLSAMAFLLIIIQVILGCSGDDPVGVGERTGSITINADPDYLKASWMLTSPGGETLSGVGDKTLPSLKAGEYSITWDSIPGWYRAPGEHQTSLLMPDSNLTFNCLYAEDPIPVGVVVIDIVPIDLQAPWSLVTPNVRTITGRGDTLLTARITGNYTLTWRDIEGWESPPTQTVKADLKADSTLYFLGHYTKIVIPTGTISIDVSPDGLEAPWTLEAPGEAVINGQGDRLMTSMPLGNYQLTFEDLTGWTTPVENPVSGLLEADAQLDFNGAYVEEIIERGSIRITCLPGDQDIPWTLYDSQQQVAVGVGDTLMVDMPTGLYQVLWGELPGWLSPEQNPSAALLHVDETVEFIGEYTEISWGVGIIDIDPDPNSLNAPWELLGPDGYSLIDRGDLVLSYMPVGEYTLNWSPLANWLTPESATLELLPDGIITFHGMYEYSDPSENNILIEVETFWMGSAEDQFGRLANETRHLVTLTRDYWMKTDEVTMGEYCEMLQWAYDRGYVTVSLSDLYDNMAGGSAMLVDMDDLMGRLSFDGAVFSCLEPKKPMVEITWYGAATYCDWLNLREGYPISYRHSDWQHTALFSVYDLIGYRLPTEAEWEFACGLGSGMPFNTGSCLESLTDANYNGNFPYADAGCDVGPYLGSAAGVGSYNPSVLGLYDMHGNVWEWCWDGYTELGVNPVINPEGSSTNTKAVMRGGSWVSPAVDCRIARRNYEERNYSYSYIGFRVARTN